MNKAQINDLVNLRLALKFMLPYGITGTQKGHVFMPNISIKVHVAMRHLWDTKRHVLIVVQVLIPILENPANRSSWPEMVQEDVANQLYQLRGTVYRMWGHLRGQTLLPLPFGLDQLERAERRALST